MEKVLIADFSSGKDRVTVRGLWQFDRGVKLKVIGINAADVNRVDFAPVVASEAVPVVVVPDEDGTFTVSIPGAATKSPYDVTAYIYVDTAEYGYTVKAVSMPVILRPEAGKSGEEEKPDPFGEVVEKVSGYATEARDSARAAAESEKAASESATQAEKAKEASRESAEKAAESKEAAATSATAASGSAESAAQSAETAKTAADTAGKSASAAQQAARSAAESASTATAAAQTATTAAGKAAGSATSASQSAENAGQKATAAETAAGKAAESATAAEKFATAAKASETAAAASAVTATEQAEKIKASAEQIEKNKTDVTSLKEEIANVSSLQNDIISLKADKTSLATTDRKLDALWKLNQGISYEFQIDDTEAYQKTVPSGAKLASVKSVGGKTIVWNQLFENPENERTQACKDANNYVGFGWYDLKGYKAIIGHTYLVSFECYMERTDTFFGIGVGNYIGCGKLNNNSNAWSKVKKIVTTQRLDYNNDFYIFYNAAPRTMEIGEEVKTRNVNVFDLTKMFGPGNEPGTVETFEAMFPADYYPYNPGELLSAAVSEVVEQGRNLIDARKVVSKKGDVTFENLGNGRIHVYGSTDTRSEIEPVYVDEKDFPPGQYRINVIGNSGISITFVTKNKVTGEKTWCNDKFEITDNDIPLYWYIMAVKCTVDIVITPQITAGDTELPALVYHDPVSFAVPEAVRQLPGYGWSAGNVCNEVDWESKKYIQRIGHYEFSENTAVRLLKNNYTDIYCAFFASTENVKLNIAVNGILSKNFASKYIGGNTNAEGVCCETTGFLEYKVQFEKLKCAKEDDDDTIIAAIKKYMTEIAEEAKYPLVEPIITDVSDLSDNAFQEPFEVESGGTLTFRNSNGDGFKIPVPNTEEYIVSLTEIGGATE